MHAPWGHALMGWVPYPPHMGPHFVGPIVGAQRAPQKKKMWDGGIHVNQPSKITKQINRENMCAGNLGQILCEIGLNLRLDVCLPPPQPLLQRWKGQLKYCEIYKNVKITRELGSEYTDTPKICVVKVANLKSCMLLAKLSCGMGHNSYGEAAWPNDIVYIFAVLIYGLGVLIFGLSIACPLEIMSCSNAFSTPLEIVPEWYLLLCFNLLRIVTSKGIGVKEMVILVPIIICLCIIENVSVYSNPFRRAIMVCVTLVYSIFAIWLSVGSLVRIDKALPLL